MFGHKCFLRIGQLTDISIHGLQLDGYELQTCNFSFSQGVDKKGKAQTEVKGGMIHIMYSSIPDEELVNWMLNSRKYVNGAIVICDATNTPVEKILFNDAACIGMDIDYSEAGKSYTTTRLIIQARKMLIGNTTLTNKWANFKTVENE